MTRSGYDPAYDHQMSEDIPSFDMTTSSTASAPASTASASTGSGPAVPGSGVVGPGGSGFAVSAVSAVGGGLEPSNADPDLDDPRLAAARYRALFAELAAARAKLDERTRVGQDQRGAQARRHREAAEMIRDRVAEVWDSVGPHLAQHGVNDLDQLRPSEATGTPAAVGSGAGAGAGAGLAVAVGDLDPREAVKAAHDQCMAAMAKAAELRAVSRASASASAGFVAGAACVLVGAGTAGARLGLGTLAGPCLAIGAVVAWLAVSALTDAGRLVAVRAGLVGAGSAGIAVLATLRSVPNDVVGVAAALLAVAAAVRFGIGVGGTGNSGGSGGGGSGGRSGGGGRR